MIKNKIIGYFLIALATLLSLTIIGLIADFIGAIFGLIRVFIDKSLEPYQIGKIIGTALYWFFHVAFTIVLWVEGLKQLKKKNKLSND